MNKDYQNTLELIESYLLDEMDDGQVLSFENRLKVEPDLYKVFQEERKVFLAVKDEKGIDFIQTVSGLLQKQEAVKNKINISWLRPFLAIAASIIFISTIYFLFKPAVDYQTLYVESYEVYPMINSVRSTNLSDRLVTQYESKNWNEVINLLSDNSINSIPAEMSALYKAIAHLELNQPLRAKEILSLYQTKQSNPMYQEVIDWYLALTYIKLGDIDKSQDLLEKIIRDSNEQSAIYNKASRLKNNL